MARRDTPLEYVVESLLAVAVVLGAVFAWPEQRKAAEVRGQLAALGGGYGEMPISDLDSFHFVRLSSAEPGEFRWRVYAPQLDEMMLLTEVPGHYSYSPDTLKDGPYAATEGLLVVNLWNQGDVVWLDIRLHCMNGKRLSTPMQINAPSVAAAIERGDFSRFVAIGENGIEKITRDQMTAILTFGKLDTDTGEAEMALRLGAPEAWGKMLEVREKLRGTRP